MTKSNGQLADRSAAPAGGRRPNVLVRLFSSVQLGIALLTLILIYASIGSALPQVRGALEMTEMQVFQHWTFVTLVVLFCTTMIVTTWRRVRWNITNLGVLTVHTGLLLLVGGSVWYFGWKVEGDTFLEAPRIELVSLGPGGRVVDQILAEKDRTWANTMPAMGGAVRLRVVETASDAAQPVKSARVEAQVGDAAPLVIPLSAGDAQPARINDRLGLRLSVAAPVTIFYDNELPALFFRRATQPASEQKYAAIHGLPLHRERFLPDKDAITDRNGRVVESKRVVPEFNLWGLKIPTGWLEHWRLPIALDAPALPFDVEVTGYLPYVSGIRTVAVAGPAGVINPAINVSFQAGDTAIERAMFAADPRDSMLPTPAPIEFRWAATAEERAEIVRSLAGTQELTIEVKDPPARQTVTIREGQNIQIEGTPYELTVRSFDTNWPLMSPGFEGSSTPMVSVDVNNGEKRYNRTVIQRFPQFTQDIDETGKRHRDAPYDPNLILRYRGAPSGWLTIVAGPTADAPVEIVFHDDKGRATRTPLVVGKSQPVQVWGNTLAVKLAGLFASGERSELPQVEPIEFRRPNLGRQPSAMRLKLTGRGEHREWTRSEWCMFSNYPQLDARPLLVNGPDGEPWELVYSRYPHSLGGELSLQQLVVKYFPGRTGAESWRSNFYARLDGQKQAQPASVYTNQTYTFGNWTLFQSGAPRDNDWAWTILGVGNRLGIWPMLLGCTLIPLGCIYAFYVKPVIIRRRQAAALALAQARGQAGRGEPPARQAEADELVEASRL